MKKELSKSFLLLKTSIKKHSPEILTGIGIAGMITTTEKLYSRLYMS